MSVEKRIDEAFEQHSREYFLPPTQVPHAHVDTPLPIGYGQTNSQPSTVRQMLVWLDPGRGDKVLDVGSGSGWTTALLAHLVGGEGEVYAVEKIPELLEFGAQNCTARNLSNVQFYLADKEFGLPEHAPYDRILVSAGAITYPKPLIDQLSVGGRAVIPIKSSIHVLTKHGEDNVADEEFPGYAFVPLVG